jgi:bifunctional non-homologous end joining protein LigD
MRTQVVTGKRGQTLRYCVLQDLPSLLWAANLGTIELHPFQAPISHPEEPRAMVFDLDPGPGCDLRDCARAALGIRDALGSLASFVKTSGVKGLHVFVPLNGGARYADCSQNDPGKQTVAPYSFRATSVPLVSAPLAWGELEAPTLIQPRAALERIERHGDLFADVLGLRQSL